MKFKIGDKVLYQGKIRTIEKVHIYDNNLTGFSASSQLFAKVVKKDYTLNIIKENLWFENYADEKQLKPLNSTLIKEKLGIK